MSGNYVDTAFAEDGDLTAVPFTITSDGSVNWVLGYGPDYELPLDESDAIPVEREKMNWLFNFITAQIQQYQQGSVPLFITSDENNGTAFAYGIGVNVGYNPGSGLRRYQSLKNNNTDLPTVTTSWQDVSLPFSGVLFTGGVSTGTASAQVVATAEGDFTNSAGNILTFQAGFSNVAGPTTIKPDGGAAIPIKIQTPNGLIDPNAGAITSTGQYMLISDGANLQLLNPATQQARIPLIANTTFYISKTTGSDANTGTAASPWLTRQHAWNSVQATYDLGIFNAIFQLEDSANYNDIFVASGLMVGQSTPQQVTFTGNPSTPTSVVISSTGSDSWGAENAMYQIEYLEFQNTGGNGIFAQRGSTIAMGPGLTSGACSGAKISASYDGQVLINNNFTDTGNAQQLLSSSVGGKLIVNGGITITAVGNPAYSTSVALSIELGCILFQNTPTAVAIFSGAMTGTRYVASLNSIIQTQGSGPNYIPGTLAGTTATGGQYA